MIFALPVSIFSHRAGEIVTLHSHGIGRYKIVVHIAEQTATIYPDGEWLKVIKALPGMEISITGYANRHNLEIGINDEGVGINPYNSATITYKVE